MKQVKFYNGQLMPQLGLGVFRVEMIIQLKMR